MPSQLVWLITGTSCGLGYELCLAALRRGDKVIATDRTRSFHKLDSLKSQGAVTLELDVTWDLDVLRRIVKMAVEIYGRIDVLVNNAGYVTMGTLEETNPQETQAQFSTNVFGALNVTRACLPYMREKKTGTIIFIGSITSWNGLAYLGLYSATKWALRGMSNSLNDEISRFGLKSICIDFGYFRTPVFELGQRTPRIDRIAEYKENIDIWENFFNERNGTQIGDPKEGAERVVDIVRGEGMAANKPLSTNIVLGTDCYEVARDASEAVLRRLETWEDVSVSTNYEAN